MEMVMRRIWLGWDEKNVDPPEVEPEDEDEDEEPSLLLLLEFTS